MVDIEKFENEACENGTGYFPNRSGKADWRDQTDDRHDRIGRLQSDIEALYRNLQGIGKDIR